MRIKGAFALSNVILYAKKTLYILKYLSAIIRVFVHNYYIMNCFQNIMVLINAIEIFLYTNINMLLLLLGFRIARFLPKIKKIYMHNFFFPRKFLWQHEISKTCDGPLLNLYIMIYIMIYIVSRVLRVFFQRYHGFQTFA